MASPPVHVHPDPATLARAAAQRFVNLARSAISRRGVFHVALAGGNTPRRLYQTLAAPPWREAVDWSCLQVFFGDERAVAPDHPDSNYRMARENLLDHLPIPATHVHRMKGESPHLETAATEYEELLTRMLPVAEGGVPCFDLILLGLGPDGHIASLFPGTPVLEIHDRWVAPVYVDKLRSWRLTLTLPVLNRARHLLLLVAGAAKNAIVCDVFARREDAPRYPVERLSPRGTLEWFLDEAAAANTGAEGTRAP